MIRAIPKETFFIIMEDEENIKFVKGKEYEYKQLPDGFIINGENGAVKLSIEEAKKLFNRKIKLESCNNGKV